MKGNTEEDKDIMWEFLIPTLMLNASLSLNFLRFDIHLCKNQIINLT